MFADLWIEVIRENFTRQVGLAPKKKTIWKLYLINSSHEKDVFALNGGFKQFFPTVTQLYLKKNKETPLKNSIYIRAKVEGSIVSTSIS